MRITSLAKRYAGALFQAARDAGAVDGIESDLGLVTYSFKTIPRLRVALSNPMIPANAKKQIVSDIFEGKVNRITCDFLMLLVDKRREDIAESVETEYVRLANELRGVAPAQVTSAYPLTEHELAVLEAKLSGFIGKQVQLAPAVDSSLIGGLVVRIGDTVMDGSIKGQLRALKDKLLGNQQ